MKELLIRQASVSDLDAVTALEALCFPASEAADRDAFFLRLRCFPECFQVAEAEGEIVAMLNGMTTDSRDLTDAMYGSDALYSADGAWLMLFGAATHPAHRRQGAASRLIQHTAEQMKQQERQGIVLTCKEALLPFYQRFGFVSEGISASVHGGAVWYQMRLCFEEELLRSALTGAECSFYQNGRRYLLYGWRQCDGDYLNVSDDTGSLVWQTAKSGSAACRDFEEAYRRGAFS